MILRAMNELELSLPESVMIGDKQSDIAAARVARVGRAFLIRSGDKESTLGEFAADGVFDNLADCVDALLRGRS